jgi:hypothetical protein
MDYTAVDLATTPALDSNAMTAERLEKPASIHCPPSLKIRCATSAVAETTLLNEACLAN